MTEALLFETDGRGVARLTLNRPERRNALDGDLVGALLARLATIDGGPEIRVLILTGSGEAFCSGADIDWMGARLVDTPEANRAHAGVLADLMQRLNGLSKPTIARIQGPAYGGGVGLITCCDIAIASATSVFALSEARLGLAPAVIAPYVIAAVGQRQARRLFLTGVRIDAHEAQRLGLVHRAVPAEQLDEAVEAEVGCLLAGGPEALALLQAYLAGKPVEGPGAHRVRRASHAALEFFRGPGGHLRLSRKAQAAVGRRTGSGSIEASLILADRPEMPEAMPVAAFRAFRAIGRRTYRCTPGR